MSKSKLIDEVAAASDASKAETDRWVTRIFDGIRAVVGTGEIITIQGFGTFYMDRKPKRQTRNPKTGEMVDRDAEDILKLRPSKAR